MDKKKNKNLTKNNIKIALISFQKDAERVPPIGLIYIATYVYKKLNIPKENIRVIDINFHDIKEEIIKFKPDIIGLSSMTANYSQALELAKKLKSLNKPIILGGVHISTLPNSFQDCFDIGVVGEGEETFKELIELYIKKRGFNKKDLKKIKSIVFLDSGKLIQTNKRVSLELDSLPFLDYEFADKNYFKKEPIFSALREGIKGFVITSRGCPYRCLFCSTSHFWEKVRMHSPEYVAEQVKILVDKYHIDHLIIMDDLFAISKERVKKIKEEMIKNRTLDKIKGIEIQMRANLMDEELGELFKSMKVKMASFGFESGSEKILNYLKCGSVKIEDSKRAMRICRKYGINVYGSFMLGIPGESLEDMKKTIDLMDYGIKQKAIYLWSFVLTPLPSTPFWEIAKKRGKVSDNMDWSKFSYHNIDDPLLLDENIDKKEFKRIFLEGRKRLSKLKVRFILRFIFYNPFFAARIVAKEPIYYAKRFYKQIFKQ